MNVPHARRVKVRARQAWLLLAGGISVLATSGCGAIGTSSTSASSATGTPGAGTGTPTPVNNIQSIQVSVGTTTTEVNQLLTSVTICVPNTATCQTISNVIVDTGSVGLRVVSPVVTLAVPRVSDDSGNPLGNCVSFVNGAYAWGPMATADIQLAGEKASSVPIQLMADSSFPAVPSACDTGSAVSASTLGANGILGVGVLQQDCGSACTGSTPPSIYFGCPSSGCAAEAVSLEQQLQNPVSLFPQDNNGLIISLPTINDTGGQLVSGSLTFGVGTQSNNALSTVQIYTTDANGNFTITFNNSTYTNSFLDSGSNGIFFLNSAALGIPACSDNTSFYCPSSTVNYSALATGANGVGNTIAFGIANADSLFATGNTAFDDLGGPSASGFDFGLPFFFGRYVYVAIEGRSTSAGAGPYVAF